MNADNHQFQTLRTLILKSQYESLNESEIAELNTLIQSDGGAQEAATLIDQLCAFTDSGSLDSLPMAKIMSGTFRNGVTEGTLAASAEPKSTNTAPVTLADANAESPRHRALYSTQSTYWTKAYWLVGIAASHLLIASLAWSLAKTSLTNTPVAEITLEATPPQLLSMTACVWHASGSTVPTIGEPIHTGDVLNLVEGVAELRIGEDTPSEALVRMEGPASIFIRADGQLGFRHGTLTAKSIGTGIEKVTIETPIGEVLIDGQSSIGLVSHNTVNEVHLFAGRALVRPTRVDSTATKFVLEQGDAVRYTSKPGNELETVKFEASLANFASSRSNGFDPLRLDENYVDAVLDSKPSIYWRFEELAGEAPHYVVNQGSAPNMDAVPIGNPGWHQYGDNRVAELGGSATSSAFQALQPWPEKPLDEYTVEMWVKPQLFHHGEVICLHEIKALKDGRHQHTMMLETIAQHYYTHRLKDSPPNRFRFVHRSLGSRDPISATNMYAENPYLARVWQHVVAQKQGDRQLLWIDGQLSAERFNPVPLSQNAQILVGQVYPTSTYRRFVGQIDEIAIYDRCLSPQELRKHIKAAGRSVAPKELGLSAVTKRRPSQLQAEDE
ncbi:hypothetical protein CA13_29660 [Planctomycetes bacterium CA13]|uniref:LamG-like jellyroll fold domain-containing protein n=1 Tax=Novipirellula herctigrandis TaxID=2527986 RepID=A0A5C5Z4N4_9BACT|nr:hypothetical protein CA13_29660 [Planctomycetes bacterium CA13]